MDRVTVLQYMESHGGGFASALAKAWLRADESNHRTLMAGFSSLYNSYAKQAEKDTNWLATR